METGKTLDALLGERMEMHRRRKAQQEAQEAQTSNGISSAALPPTMQKAKDTSVDDLIREMNRIPLFMTSLDETDGAGGDNPELEALRALAYEGTRAEIAQNFREQGTELIRLEKRYREARDFYTKALQALHAPRPEPDPELGPQVIEIDEVAELEKERSIEEACLTNRALCNLEMKNYGSCNRDCAEALRLNPKNVKAWYRAASACLALDKVPETLDACNSGLKFEPANSALKSLLSRCEARRDQLAKLARLREQQQEQQRKEASALQTALRNRGIPTRVTPRPPEIPDSAIALSEPLNPESTLSFPVMLCYPAHAQTDFIKAFAEDTSVAHHLEYILPLPWDEAHEYASGRVDAYMETVNGGLIKVGKKISLGQVLGGGKIEIVDRLVTINILPRDKVDSWIEEFKARRGK